MRIGATHPVRKAIVKLPTYYASLSRALGELNLTLNVYGIVAEQAIVHGREGRLLLELLCEENEIVCRNCGESEKVFDNWLVVYWYTLESGTVEVTAYVS